MPVNGTTNNCLSGEVEYPEAVTAAGTPVATEWTIYPNPAKDWFYLSLLRGEEKVQMVNMTIFDLEGKQVMTREVVIQSEAPFKVEIGNLAAGIYLVQLRSEAGVQVKKVMVY